MVLTVPQQMLVGLWGLHKLDLINGCLFDHPLSEWHILRNMAQQQNVELRTLDMVDDLANLDALLLINMPSTRDKLAQTALKLNKPTYLLQAEHWYSVPENWSKANLSMIRKTFTWSDPHVDHIKHIKLNYTHVLPQYLDKTLCNKEGFCTMIASNNTIQNWSAELYAQRREAIRWFQKNHPEQFDLYGKGWDYYKFSGPWYVRGWSRIKPLTKILATHCFPSYKGPLGGIENKLATLKRYKFAICYENIANIPGYITEKIMHCFIASCVPVYWGANNVSEHIPANCYIDRTAFDSYEALYDYMVNLTDADYLQYLHNIETFFLSDQGKLFSSDHFAETVMKHITEQ